MYKYKTKDGSDCVIPGVGQTTDGVIDTPIKIENPNFELVSDDSAQPTGHVQGVAPQATQTAPQPVESQPVDQTIKESE